MAKSETLIALMIGAACFKVALSVADERIWLEGKINGKSARLCFDSGSGILALSPQALRKLELKFIPAPTNDFSPGVLAGDTEECALSLFGREVKTTFLVLDLPGSVRADFDGMIGWYSLSQNVLQLDALSQELEPLPKVPPQTTRWTRFSIVTNCGSLDLEIPHTDRTNGVLCIDTGSDRGLGLPAQEWRRWKAAHPHNPITLETGFTLLDGFLVHEEAWAEQISVGPIVLTGVPIEQAGPGIEARWGTRYEGTLGLAALKRLDLIVDGNHNLAFLRPKKSHPPAYAHNRLGAVFLPSAALTNQAVAWVVEGGPAYDAGVRNGDVLLQVDDVKVTGWNNAWIGRFSRPAGTKLELTLSREGKTLKTTANLREILQTASNRGR